MNNNNTYQKSYGAVPSDVSSSDNSPAVSNNTKRASRQGMLIQGAVLAATLVAGVLVGSAAAGYYNADRYWNNNNNKETAVKPAAPVAGCENHNNTTSSNHVVDTQAEQWAKIKQESLRKWFVVGCFSLSSSSSSSLFTQLTPHHHFTSLSSTVQGLTAGAVSTDDGRCSDVGNDILQTLGGNAVDAAVAVTLCLGIVNPSGSTPGGGGVSGRMWMLCDYYFVMYMYIHGLAHTTCYHHFHSSTVRLDPRPRARWTRSCGRI